MCKSAGARIRLENTLMKWCLFALLLAGPTVVRAQQRPGLFDAIPKWRPDSALMWPRPAVPLLSEGPGRQDGLQKLLAMQESSVRIMMPDRMPCQVPDLTKVEHMPVSRNGNADRMPNPLVGRGGHRLYH